MYAHHVNESPMYSGSGAPKSIEFKSRSIARTESVNRHRLHGWPRKLRATYIV